MFFFFLGGGGGSLAGSAPSRRVRANYELITFLYHECGYWRATRPFLSREGADPARLGGRWGTKLYFSSPFSMVVLTRVCPVIPGSHLKLMLMFLCECTVIIEYK